MKVSIAETAEHIEYTVIEREDVADDILQGMFYALEGGQYRKRYPKERLMFAHDLSQLEKNYNAFLTKELHQEKRTTPDLEKALKWVSAEFKQRHIRWWLTGSAALFARGLPVKPHDLDVMTFKTEIDSIRDVVTPYIVEPFHHVTGWVVKGFGVIDYDYRIDVAFEPEDGIDDTGPMDFGQYAQSHLEIVEWQGERIKVPPIELQIAPNESRGRHERVELIRRYLSGEFKNNNQ